MLHMGSVLEVIISTEKRLSKMAWFALGLIGRGCDAKRNRCVLQGPRLRTTSVKEFMNNHLLNIHNNLAL